MNVTDIEQAVGMDLSIITKDKNGNEFTIGSGRITRVIKDEVSGLTPSNNTSITQQPINFQWNKFNAGYDFTYTLEVYSPDLVYKKENISSDSTSYIMPQNLAQGTYYWVLWIIDKYQNRSRSKQSYFIIQ